ncbi:MAG: hypothetical protein HOO96_00370 [Polyangiaceae bacterium]|nr:hypothetical protein [Polyangiaceae bacterium]
MSSSRQKPLVLAASSVFAGASAYAFQLLASSSSAPSEFAALNGWIFYVSAAATAGVVLQYYVSLRGPRARLTGPARTAMGVLAASVLGATLLLSARLPPWATGMLAVASQLAYGYAFGAFQASADLVALAALNVVVSVVRLGVPFALGLTAASFRSSMPASTSAATLVAVLFFRELAAKPAEPAATKSDSAWKPLLPALLLTGAATTFPFLDSLLVNAALPDDVAGEFARVQVAGRALFFGGLILLQVAYPYQLRAARGEGGAGGFWTSRADGVATALVAVGGVVLTVGLPRLWPLWAKSDLPWTWPALVSVNFTLLFAVYARVQRAAAVKDVRGALVAAALLAVAAVAVPRLGTTVQTIGVAAGAFYALALVALVVLRPASPAAG